MNRGADIIKKTLRYVKRRINWIVKLMAVLGLVGGVKYSVVYFLHRHCYIKQMGKKEISFKLYGKYNLSMRMFSRDIDFFRSIWIGNYVGNGCEGEYDISYDMDAFDGILDLGANIGLFTVLYAINNPDKKIVALEPERTNFKLLTRNTSQFGNVECLQKGVWYRDAFCKVYPGRVMMEKSGTCSEGSFYIGECEKEDEGAMWALSIQSIMKNSNMTKCIVKMDIEGAESEIFEIGDLSWLEHCYMLVIETHEWLLNNNIDSVIASKMEALGFQSSCLGENKIYMRPKQVNRKN